MHFHKNKQVICTANGIIPTRVFGVGIMQTIIQVHAACKVSGIWNPNRASVASAERLNSGLATIGAVYGLRNSMGKGWFTHLHL